MQTNVIYIGIDVDDNSYHGCAFNHNTGEIIDFKTRPTLKPLVEKLKTIQNNNPDCRLKICYEASYIAPSAETLNFLKNSVFRFELWHLQASQPLRSSILIQNARVSHTSRCNPHKSPIKYV